MRPEYLGTAIAYGLKDISVLSKADRALTSSSLVFVTFIFVPSFTRVRSVPTLLALGQDHRGLATRRVPRCPIAVSLEVSPLEVCWSRSFFGYTGLS